MGKIHEFIPVIYPFRLWVGMNVTDKDIKDKFFAYNVGDDTISDISEVGLSDKSVAPQPTLSAAGKTI